MCPSVRKVPTEVATLARRRNPGGCAVKLNRQQSQKLLQERGIWITEACDRCGRLLGSVCWTQRGAPGDWCSAECRDGVAGPVPILKATAKECLECGVPLQGKRSDSEFCMFRATPERESFDCWFCRLFYASPSTPYQMLTARVAASFSSTLKT
jgi:hypothetical protein